MAFRDLGEMLADEPIVLSIRGREFRFPGSVSARIGLQLQRIVQIVAQARAGTLDPSTPAITDAEQDALYDAMLGDEKEALLDYATSREYQAVCHALFNAHVHGRELAERIWNNQGEAAAPSQQTKSPEGPATSAQSRGFRGGSTSPKKPARRARRGQTSSASGDS